jgi:DHA1 family bicyclomycin/chloramphenicol resistance-like MFS transporter
VFAATSLAIMGGAFANGRLSDWHIPSRYPLGIGLVLAAVLACVLLTMALMGLTPLIFVIPLLIIGNFAFGLVAPNTLHEAMQPLPQIAGIASAAAGSIQMGVGAVSSGLVAFFYDGHSALSMAFVMCLCSLLALISYLSVAGSAERAVTLS